MKVLVEHKYNTPVSDIINKMKFDLLLFVLLTLYHVKPSLANVVSKTLDKERVARLFTTDQRVSGHTYLDTLKLESVIHMVFGGISMDTITHTTVESETIVSDDPDRMNYRLLDTKMIRMMYEMESVGGTQLLCDTQNGIDHEQESEMCALFYQTMGQESHYVTDKHGLIVEANGPNAELMKTISESNVVVDVNVAEEIDNSSSSVSNSDTRSDAFSTLKQIEEQSCILGLIKSDGAIQPGDTWDSSIDMGEVGLYDGTGTLLGYREVDGVDCAVFSNEGSFHIDYENIVSAIFGKNNNMFGELFKDVNISDASMTTLVYYEYETNLVRWSKTSQLIVMEMPDPMDDSKKMSIPLEQNIVTTSRIKPE